MKRLSVFENWVLRTNVLEWLSNYQFTKRTLLLELDRIL
jgi:hypothetical protein